MRESGRSAAPRCFVLAIEIPIKGLLLKLLTTLA